MFARWKNRILRDTPAETGGAPVLGGAGGEGGGEGATATVTTPAETASAGEKAWFDSLPTEIKDSPTIKKYKDPAALAAAHVALERHLGSDKIPVPGKGATEEDWKGVFKKLGVPEKIEDYKVTFKEGTSIDEKFSQGIMQTLHAAGVLPSQAQKIADWLSDMSVSSTTEFVEQRKAAQAKEINDLKTEWGAGFQAKLGRANEVLKTFGDKELAQYLEESGEANNTKLIKFLSSVGDALFKEGKIVEGQGSVGVAGMSPAEAKSAANKIIADTSHPYNVKEHPSHKAAVEEVQALFQQASRPTA